MAAPGGPAVARALPRRRPGRGNNARQRRNNTPINNFVMVQSTLCAQMDMSTTILNNHVNTQMVRSQRIAVEEFVRYFENHLRAYLPGGQLKPYGSFFNGFCCAESDLDLSFSFADRPNMMENRANILETIAWVLNDIGIETLTILDARIPIVKCYVPEIGRSLDITYMNDLASANTRLLNCYSKWGGYRVIALGLWVKKWSKDLGMGSTATGGLSSYCWIIMLIHYLQECDPPVLPRLQEISVQPVIQDGRNVSYYRGEPDEQRLFISTNTRSVHELWVGFLEYYASFDYNNKIIQIRTSNRNEWWRTGRMTNGFMAVQDPFELDHNIAYSLRENMFEHIQEVIIRSRHAVTTFRVEEPIERLAERYFASCRVGLRTDPTWCDYCRMTGHYTWDCFAAPYSILPRAQHYWYNQRGGLISLGMANIFNPLFMPVPHNFYQN